MNIADAYRRNADDCEALARNAPDEKQREQIKSIADTWRKLAAERERWLKTQQHAPNRS